MGWVSRNPKNRINLVIEREYGSFPGGPAVKICSAEGGDICIPMADSWGLTENNNILWSNYPLIKK